MTAAGASVALPGVLMWLLVVCALKAPLARAPLALQWRRRRSRSARSRRSARRS